MVRAVGARQVGEDLKNVEALLARRSSTRSEEDHRKCAAYLTETLRLRELGELEPEVRKLKREQSLPSTPKEHEGRARGQGGSASGLLGAALGSARAQLAMAPMGAWLMLAAVSGLAIGLHCSARGVLAAGGDVRRWGTQGRGSQGRRAGRGGLTASADATEEDPTQAVRAPGEKGGAASGGGRLRNTAAGSAATSDQQQQ